MAPHRIKSARLATGAARRPTSWRVPCPSSRAMSSRLPSSRSRTKGKVWGRGTSDLLAVNLEHAQGEAQPLSPGFGPSQAAEGLLGCQHVQAV